MYFKTVTEEIFAHYELLMINSFSDNFSPFKLILNYKSGLNILLRK